MIINQNNIDVIVLALYVKQYCRGELDTQQGENAISSHQTNNDDHFSPADLAARRPATADGPARPTSAAHARIAHARASDMRLRRAAKRAVSRRAHARRLSQPAHARVVLWRGRFPAPAAACAPTPTQRARAGSRGRPRASSRTARYAYTSICRLCLCEPALGVSMHTTRAAASRGSGVGGSKGSHSLAD
jgi:hypothetical protein